MNTPGPWTANCQGTQGARTRQVIIFAEHPLGNAADDARLISAAPELLEACGHVADRLTAWRDTAHGIYKETGSEDAYNLRGNYDSLLSFIEPAIAKTKEGPL